MCFCRGLIAYASSLDCPAVCARSVADAALSLHVMASSGEGTDALYSPGPRAPLLPDGQGIGTLDGVTIGVPEEYCVEELGEESLDAWRKGLQWLADGGVCVCFRATVTQSAVCMCCWFRVCVCCVRRCESCSR